MRHVITNSPDHMNDADGRENMTARQYDLPVVRGKARADEITAAVLADVDPRSHVNVVHDVNVNRHLDPTRATVDHRPDPMPEPSWHTSATSARKVTRNKRGTSTVVTSRGRVHVVGSSDWTLAQATHIGNVPASVAKHAIDTLREHNRFGHVDGDALARLTDRLYGSDIPALIGTDHYGWSEATPEIPMDTTALQALIVTTAGLSGGASATLDGAVAPRGHGRHNGTLTAYRRKMPTFPIRTRVSSLKPRKADDNGRTRFTIIGRGYGPHNDNDVAHNAHGTRSAIWRTIEVRGATGEPGTFYIGRRKVEQSGTLHGSRVARSTIVETFTIDALPELATIAASLIGIGPARYAWQTGTASGTLTVDKRRRVSVVGDGVTIRQATSLKTLRRKLADI